VVLNLWVLLLESQFQASVYINSVFSNETIMTTVAVISCIFNTVLYIMYASND